ncbi:Uncharacterised protein [Mycobacteroides abscessus subsp. abscessus]|nr:Uncharacterised protein [Mycobacteroides abscessus subsp. abscessus]
MSIELGVEGGDDVRGPPDAAGFVDETLADGVHEIADMDVDRGIGALGVIGCLGFRWHIASGDTGRLEAGVMVVGVEVAVGGMARISRLRGPHAVAHRQVAAEGNHVGVAHRAAQRRVSL